MFRKLSFALSWLVLISGSAWESWAQAIDATSSEAKAAAQRALVQQLGDPTYYARARAEESLVSQGLAAEPALTEALHDPNAEIRSRARRILKRVRADAPAQEAAVRSHKAEPTAAQRTLVQQLGDPSYFTRKRADEVLASQGLAAEAALMEALQDPDAEIRWRARRLLNRVRAIAFEARLAAFIADVDGNQRHGLPGWERFWDLVGHRRDAREMFAAMTRTEGALLSAYGNQAPDLQALFAERVDWLRAITARKTPDPLVASPETVATLLLIGSDETIKDHSKGLHPLYLALRNWNAMQSIGPADRPSILCTLLEAWATAAASKGSNYGMMLALKYDLEELGLEQAVNFIVQKTKSSQTLQHAIIAIGRFGGEKHIRFLTPLLENKTVCHRWSNSAIKKDGNINIEVRDVALVVLLRMTGRDPVEYGFKLLKENPETLYYVYTFGFVDDEEREATHAKWAAEAAVISSGAETSTE